MSSVAAHACGSTTGNWTGYVQMTNGSADLTQTRAHNVANELTTATSWATSAADRAGNMTTVPKPSSLATGLTLKYDAWNRLVEVKEGQTVLGQYRYDGDGRRTGKYAPGASTYEHAFYLGEQLVETRETASPTAEPEALQPKYQWIWSARYIDAAILRDENTDQDGLCDDTPRLYFLTDANMNVTTLVDTAGDAVERYVYDPYGRVTIYDATWSNARATSSYNNQTLYTGRTLDGETGLYFYRARYYSAELGRFVGRDPLGYGGSRWNLYQYVAASPLNRADPSGMGGFGFQGRACLSAIGAYNKCVWDNGVMYSACIGAIVGTGVLEEVGCAALCAWAITGSPGSVAACHYACTVSVAAFNVFVTLPMCNEASLRGENICAGKYNQATLRDRDCCRWNGRRWCGESCQNLRPR